MRNPCLNISIELNADISEIQPQNSNHRGYHEPDPSQDPLDDIIVTFNQTYFGQWDATPEEQRIKLLNLAQNVTDNPDYRTQVVNNPDPQTSRLTIAQLIKQAINQERRKELTLYKNFTQDPDFQRVIENSIIHILESESSLDREKYLAG